jgi:hypothetical protein
MTGATQGQRILIIGANGQIGSELAGALSKRAGVEAVITSDVAPTGRSPGLIHEQLDVTDAAALTAVVERHHVTQIYLLAAALSANGEKHPQWAWNLNMVGLLNVLELARTHKLDKVFWPSSIAAFGPSTPADGTPQDTVMDPTTIYGISKLAGERWCAWYHKNHGVDVRSLRYPGLISWKTPPGGGTTDYAVEIFHSALRDGRYTCFLKEDQALPMMLMDAARHHRADGGAVRFDPPARQLQPVGDQLHAAPDRGCDREAHPRLHDGLQARLPSGHRRQLAALDRRQRGREGLGLEGEVRPRRDGRRDADATGADREGQGDGLSVRARARAR